MHKKTSFCSGLNVPDTINQYKGSLAQKICILIFPKLPVVNWGPKKLHYLHKGARNVLHSCQWTPRVSQMPLSQGTPLGTILVEPVRNKSNTHRHFSQIYFCNNMDQIKINQELSWKSTCMLMGIRYSEQSQTPTVTPPGKVGFPQPQRPETHCWVFVASVQKQLCSDESK